ncbi:MAG: hypothetical protein RLZZ420_1494 [Bacteroidota bacterium]|jgi:hypothetical protein
MYINSIRPFVGLIKELHFLMGNNCCIFGHYWKLEPNNKIPIKKYAVIQFFGNHCFSIPVDFLQ